MYSSIKDPKPNLKDPGDDDQSIAYTGYGDSYEYDSLPGVGAADCSCIDFEFSQLQATRSKSITQNYSNICPFHLIAHPSDGSSILLTDLLSGKSRIF